MSRRLILSWCVVLSIVVAGTSLAQDPAMWNAAKRMKFGLDAPTPAQPSTSGGAATMNPMSPPNTPDVAVFAPSANAQSENSIGVNFSNPQQLMVSTNGRIPGANPVVHQTWAFSTNGGLTWPANMQSEDLPPNVLDSFGDPVAFFDVTGRAYFCTLGSPGGIYFVSTTNFGATWSARSNADNLNSTNDDKQHAAADYSGTYPNNVYAAWTDFGVTGSPVVFARSTNQGQTWLPRVQLQIGSNRGQGVHIATGPNGEVYLMWAHYTSGTAEVGIGFAKSTDGGATFSTPTVAYTISGIRISNGGIPALNNVRAASFPYHDVDRSNGPRRGWIYAVTPELVSGQADIFLRRSTDGGATWSAPIQVNGPDVQAGKWQFMASLAVDPTNGGISVSYYSMDSVGTNFMTNRYMAYSNDGGNTWDRWVISDVRANWQPQGTPNTNATYNGDYYETAATNGKAWAIWTDRRTGTNKAYVEVVTYSENFGWVRGLVTRLGTGTAVPGVAIDFVDNIQQQGSTTDSTGFYLAGARVDTPGNTRNVTLRARKFGYIDTTIAITLTRFDTLTRNFQIRQAPSGTLSVYSHTATTNLRSFVEVKFGTLTVFADSTNGTTGRVSTTLPAGTYSVRVDAPPPYRTLNFPSVVINAAQTTNVDALTSPVLTFNPTAMRDTLPVGGSRAKNLTITNTSPDSVQFRIWDDNALRANRSRVVVPMPPVQEPPIEKPKGAPDTEFGDSPNGRGGPDAFGYSWIDSDEPGGPTFSWLDIKSVGTQITTWTGSGDDGYARVTLPFSFSFYGSPYTDAYVGTNGFLSFGAGYTSWSNTAIPTTAPPNNAIYAFWDDLNFNVPGGTAWYYYDAANQRFIVQWDSVSHYGPATTPGRYTFQVVLKQSGEVLTYYRRMIATVNSATIGIENAAGSVGLQVVFNAAYMHDSLAIRYFLPDAPWLSENPVVGTIPPNGNQTIQVTFNAAGLTPGTTYNANIFVEATHPDVTSPFVVPASLRVQPANGPLLILSKDSLVFPTTAIGSSRTDSLTARNGGDQTVNISSITRNNTDFSVTPTSANIAPGDSIRIRVTYTPTVPAGPDTGRLTITSNSIVNPTAYVRLRGNSIGVPIFRARVDSLTKTLQARNVDSTVFYVRNIGTQTGNFSARAVMYPRTEPGSPARDPIVIPMRIERSGSTPVPHVSSPSDMDRSPMAGGSSSALALGDTLFVRPIYTSTNTTNHQGIEYANGFVWTTNRGPNPSAGQNYMMKFTFNPTTKTFTLIDSVLQQSTTEFGYRDLAFDGTYLYGSESNVLKQLNASTGVETGVSITVTGGPSVIRALAYDPANDQFWTADFASAIYVFNRSGVVVRTIPNPGSPALNFYGFGWDNVSPGGPFLWAYSQDGTPAARVSKIRASDGTIVGSWQGVVNLPASEIAGGATIVPGLLPGKLVFLCMNQSASVTGYDAGDYTGGGSWLSVAPTTGSIAVNDSVRMVATFDARDISIVTNPGTYYGRIEITATNSTLADSLNIPARLTVTPVSGPALYVTPDSVNFGNVAIGQTDSSKTVMVKNIGNATANVTNITSSNPAFAALRTNFSLAPNDTLRVKLRFTAPSPGGLRTGVLSFTTNDPNPPTIRVRGTSVGQANIVVVPDTFTFSLPQSNDTTRATFRIRNTGTDTLRYTINESTSRPTSNRSIERSMEQQRSYTLGKGEVDPEPGQDGIDGQGGPDAFGYRWIDSDEPGGPQYNWFDIKSVGTQITTWTGSGDDGYARVTLPFSFSFYGSPYTDAYVGTNGFLSFGAGYTSWSNTAIPTTAPPNNAIYAFWDDLNFNVPGGTAWYYYDAANQRFIVQWDSVSHYGPATTPGRYTFQTILYRDGRILTQYRRMEGTLNSATIGIENSAGTIGLQVVFNAAYMHDNLAILFSTDILPWVSTDRTQGTIAPGDSQAVQLRVVPNQSPGTYTGRLRIIGANTPSVGIVGVRLTITGGLPSITVTSPNGGEVWRQGNTYPITWTHVSVDTVRIEYSTTGSTGPWNLITAGVPARPVTKWIHPKALARGIDGGVIDEPTGTYNWTIPTTVPNSNNCYVKISQKSNQTVFDISNAAFTITSATGDTGWVVQPSGTTATLYTVKAVSNLVAWAAGTGGVVLRTTNGGANWTNVTGAPIGTADIYTLEALDANTAFVSTSPSGTNIYRTTNGGASWALVFNEPNAAAFIDGIRMQNATTGFAMGDPLGGTWMVLRTTNGGASWARITTEPPQVGSEAGWNNSYVLIGNTMWFGTNSSKVYRSTDAGATWGSAPTTSVNSFGLHFNDLNSGMAGFAGGVTNRSTNGGTSWAAVASAGTGQVSGVGGVSGAEFWAVAATSVYYTSNGGTSWTNAAPNGYPGTQALWAISMTSASNNTYGWAVGAVGTIVRYRRTTTGVENPEGIPTVYALNQNFPNPFNPSTTIRFALPEEATVSLKVYNVLGQEVATLAEGQLPAAFHNVVWNGTNNSGVPVATGMYFYRLEATGASGQKFTSLKKLILLK